MTLPATNPFSTRYTRPGCILPLDAEGMPIDVCGLVDRFVRGSGSAAIVGPHGSGKSTLLVRLAAAMHARGIPVVRLRLHSWRDGWRMIPALWLAGMRGIVCIDGWECLRPSVRGVVLLVAGAARRRLVVTRHAHGWMTVLARCRPSQAVMSGIVGRLPGAGDWYGSLIHPADVEAAFDRHHGDIREALYELYDVFESRSRQLLPHRS